jgi:hypothetical protein
MSGNKKEVGYTVPTPETPRLTPGEYQDMALFFKDFIEKTRLAKWIIAAGIGALLEGVHIVWLALRFFLKF